MKGDEFIKALEWEEAHPDDRIIFLSDIWLDKPDTCVRLETVLSGKLPSLLPSYSARLPYSCK